jgi:hypothetical protein
MNLSIIDGKVDPKMSKCKFNAKILSKTNSNTIQGEFEDCMQDAWDTLPWWFQIGCGTSCGACVWGGIPVACGACAGCVGGMAVHCLFIEE